LISTSNIDNQKPLVFQLAESKRSDFLYEFENYQLKITWPELCARLVNLISESENQN